jgi:hypothetical protein
MGWYRWVCYVALVIITGWWISAAIGEVTACIPLEAAYTPGLHGRCVNDNEMCTSVGLGHVVFDFIVLFMPIPLIWRLKMPASSRITVTLVLVVGIL